MDYDPRIKLDVFTEPSIYRNDYRKCVQDKRSLYNYPQDYIQSVPKSRKFIRHDNETLARWHQGVYIPFNLLVKPRPIIDTSPYTKYTLQEQPVDEGKEEAIRTRPRIYMAPAVSIDDVPDPEMRKLMCQHMYTTDWKKAAKEAALPETKKILPDSTLEVKADPVTLKTDLYPPLPLGWREKGKDWDYKQRRACVDPTETFWLNKNPPVKCGACENPLKGLVPPEVKQKIAKLIEHDKLRLAHDYPMPSYAGYKPRLSAGVPLSKVDLPVTHPFLSASQAITQRYADDKRT